MPPGEARQFVLPPLNDNGTGISRGVICGKLIAEMVDGRGSDHLDTMLASNAVIGGVCVISVIGRTEVLTTQIKGSTRQNTNSPPRPYPIPARS